ncbi:AAA family ATPase [Candidatus Gottesmanbacteria bacterium]|nr:AAA family ATPase [Candidatus Gottesmanbacteria bacterium]
MKQKNAFEILKLGYNVYLTGEAGSGKTYLLNKYISYLRSKRAEVAVTASTGIAATHLGGMTIDSWSSINLPLQIAENKPYLRRRIQKTKVLIIDEISMVHGERLDRINTICKKIRGNTLPFGGIQVVLSGDFFQLPPVSEKRENFDFVYKSQSWRELTPHILYLESQYRQTDPEFNKVLSDIRNNSVTSETIELLRKTVHQPIQGPITPAKLYTHNVDADAINQEELDKISQESHQYEMISLGSEGLVASMKRGCLAPVHLVLKKEAHVMFVRNNSEEGYSNGTVGKVVGFDRDGNPIVETSDKKKIHVKPAQWTIIEEGKIRAELIQLPLRLAWAITVHKSQGMTLSAAEIDLSKSFVHGMGYVALSRVRSLRGIKLLGINNLALQVNPEITEFDRSLKEESRKEENNFKMMGFFKKFFARRKFVYFLTSR